MGSLHPSLRVADPKSVAYTAVEKDCYEHAIPVPLCLIAAAVTGMVSLAGDLPPDQGLKRGELSQMFIKKPWACL